MIGVPAAWVMGMTTMGIFPCTELEEGGKSYEKEKRIH